MRARFIFAAVGIAAIIALSLAATPYLLKANGSASTVLSLKQSGLESANPVNSTAALPNSTFAGDPGLGNASYTVLDNSSFLHIGVRAPVNGSWAGYYEVTPSTYATLVHAVLIAPSATLTSYFTNGIYIEASNQALDYVTCVAVTNSTGTYWTVVHGYKLDNLDTNPTEYNVIWQDKSANQPLSRDCVLVTNGQNSLEVYLDHVQVYQNRYLQLGMEPPFNFFVGVESEFAHQLVYGSTRDFYVSQSDTVNVTGLSSRAALVEVVTGNGTVLASGPVKSGEASVDLGTLSFPVTGRIEVFDSGQTATNSTQIASTQGAVNIFGGDVFTLGTGQSTTSKLTINSLDTNGNQLNGYYTVVMKDGVQVAADYLPTTFSLQTGQTYSIIVSNYGNYVFDHWSDGSISSIRTISISNNTNINAIFRNANSSPPANHSIISVSAVDQSGKPITGVYTTLWENGFIVAQGYTPTSFLVSSSAFYQVTVSNYGSSSFSNWQGGGNSTAYTLAAGNQQVQNAVAVFN